MTERLHITSLLWHLVMFALMLKQLTSLVLYFLETGSWQAGTLILGPASGGGIRGKSVEAA